jgi:hypothetical protein
MKNIWARPVSVIMALFLAAVGGMGTSAFAAGDDTAPAKEVVAQQAYQVSVSTADHSKFKVLDQDFQTGPEVTKACLSCHTEASLQVHKTYHWTWESSGGIQKGVGKKNVLNNF